MSIPLLDNVFRPVVADRAGIRRYVVSVTLLAWIVAVSVDAFNHLILEGSLRIFLHEASITTAVVLGIAAPIAHSIGRAHLELFKAKNEAERLGRVDPMTGLANRRAFYEAAEHPGGAVIALAIADIDRFKRINDRNGHVAGDEVLKRVAALMQEELGDLGLVARIGGEEFALLAAERPSDEMRERLQRFRLRVAEEPTEGADGPIYATVSIGFACRRDGDLDAFYAAADKALYVAKSAGRDRVVDYDQIAEIAAVRDGAPILRAG